jgi:hypothetical protein
MSLENKKFEYTFGGSMGFKLQARQYESVDANSFFTVKAEGPLTDEEIEELSSKVNNILEAESAKRLKRAYDLYKRKLTKIKQDAGY